MEGGRDILASGSRSELLLSPDPFFIDLIKTKEYIKTTGKDCSDASYVIGKYETINKSHAKLIKVDSYEFFNDQEPIKMDYNVSDPIESNSCLYCNIVTEIYASNTNKKFTKTEAHKFVGFRTVINPLKEVIEYSSMSETFYQCYKGYFKSFKLCQNLTKTKCDILLCNEVNKYFGTNILCKESKETTIGYLTPFNTTIADPMDRCG